MEQKIFARLGDILTVFTAHGNSTKQVFINGDDTQTDLTQFAYGKMDPGIFTGLHSHATMEEVFYFIKGSGIFTVSGIEYTVTAGSFVRVPAATQHALLATGEDVLEFAYFGVAVK